ncbi:MAG: hypothetical protein AAGC55_25305, partial [Myxococcota bacterium]
LVAAAAACTPSAPGDPTWAEDVAPIMAANCVRCHTAPSIAGAPNSFRLDSFGDWTGDDERSMRGAVNMASYIRTRVNLEDFLIEQGVDTMPPADGFGRLTDRQAEIITNWIDDGTPQGTRDGNEEPEITIALGDEVDGVVTVNYEIRDPDQEVVLGEFYLSRGGTSALVTRALSSGTGQFDLDIGALPLGGVYEMSATLRDASGEYDIALDTLDVSEPNNVAPRVRIINPERDGLVAIGEAVEYPIELEISDPDSTTFTVNIDAVLGQDRIEVLRNGAAILGEDNRALFLWNLSEVPEAFSWRLEVTVSDGTNERTVESGEFIVSKREASTTTDTFATVGSEVLGAFCTFCHSGPGSPLTPGLTHNFGVYNGTAESRGVYELRGLIYRRASQYRNMPPAGSGIPFPAEPMERLEAWLLAGAPEGVVEKPDDPQPLAPNHNPGATR